MSEKKHKGYGKSCGDCIWHTRKGCLNTRSNYYKKDRGSLFFAIIGLAVYGTREAWI